MQTEVCGRMCQVWECSSTEENSTGAGEKEPVGGLSVSKCQGHQTSLCGSGGKSSDSLRRPNNHLDNKNHPSDLP